MLARLFKEQYSYSDIQAVPAWMLFASLRAGAVALVAAAGEQLIGGTYAFPAFDGKRPYIYWTKLAVVPEHRGRNLGRDLIVAQRDQALRQGFRMMRATTDALSRRHLHLYTTQLPGRVVSYHPDLFQGLIPGAGVHGAVGDEVGIEWSLDGEGWTPSPDAHPDVPPLLTASEVEAGEVRAPTGSEEPGALSRYAVEVPWDSHRLRMNKPDVAKRWEQALRRSMGALLRAGFQGVGVAHDTPEQRCYVTFERLARRADGHTASRRHPVVA